MVVPLEPAPGMEVEVPEVIINSYAKWWWLLMCMWLLTVVGQFIARNIWGALAALCMASIVRSMVKNRCEKMSPPCLLLFGFLNAMGAFLDCVVLISLLGGRVEKDVDLRGSAEHGATKSYTYKVTYETHPMFDAAAGVVYNAQSAMLIASPMCNLFGSWLSYACYHSYPDSAFQEENVDHPVGLGQGSSLYGGTDAHPAVQPFQGQGQRLSDAQGPTRPFEGQGQRLGT